MAEKYLVVYGNPVDGFKFIGPFDDNQDALRAGDDVGADWWIAKCDDKREQNPHQRWSELRAQLGYHPIVTLSNDDVRENLANIAENEGLNEAQTAALDALSTEAKNKLCDDVAKWVARHYDNANAWEDINEMVDERLITVLVDLVQGDGVEDE